MLELSPARTTARLEYILASPLIPIVQRDFLLGEHEMCSDVGQLTLKFTPGS